METVLINTLSEECFRLLLLFSEIPEKACTLAWVYRLDFMAVYGREFGVSDQNLNGRQLMKYSGYALKMDRTYHALHEMVLRGWLKAEPDPSGFLYRLTGKGKKTALCFATSYAEDYRRNVRSCLLTFGEKTADELGKIILDHALMWGENAHA